MAAGITGRDRRRGGDGGGGHGGERAAGEEAAAVGFWAPRSGACFVPAIRRSIEGGRRFRSPTSLSLYSLATWDCSFCFFFFFFTVAVTLTVRQPHTSK